MMTLKSCDDLSSCLAHSVSSLSGNVKMPNNNIGSNFHYQFSKNKLIYK